MIPTASIRASVHRRAHACALVLGAVLSGLLGMPAAARAQSDNATAAEVLFEQGRDLMKQKRYAAACEKFEASHKLDPSVGALLNLGECHQKNGHTASAWIHLRQAMSLARQNGDRRREQIARERAKELEGQLSYLVIEVPERARVPGLVVTRNGAALDEALWGQPFPVDPGVHTIGIRAPGRVPQELTAEVPAGRGQTGVSVPVLAPDSDAPEQPASPDTGPGAGEVVAPPARPRRDAGMPLGRKIALVGGGMAVVAVAAGTVLGLQARSRWHDAEARCGDMPDSCNDPEAVALSKDAASAGNLSTVSFSLGLAAAAAGAVLWFVSAPDDDAAGPAGERTTQIAPVIGPDTLGASIHLRF